MTAILRTALFAAFATASIPAIAAGQGTSTADLIRRIEVLERTNAELERRVRELESIIKSQPAQSQPVPNATKWRDLANWRRLKLGMTMDEVRALLGEPERIDGGGVTHWSWTDAYVLFLDGKVRGWSEPGR